MKFQLISRLVLGIHLSRAYGYLVNDLRDVHHNFLRSCTTDDINIVPNSNARALNNYPYDSLAPVTAAGDSHPDTRQMPNFCGNPCRNNFDCDSFATGCFLCISGFCDRSQPLPTGNRLDSNCGLKCFTDSDCTNRSGPCTVCHAGAKTCASPPVTNDCRAWCTSDWECANMGGSCRRCRIYPFSDFGECTDESRSICVREASMLKRGLQDASIPMVNICHDTTITLTSEIVVLADNKLLQCEMGVGSCGIRRDPASPPFRLLTFTGHNVRISRVTFSGGQASGDGGAILMKGRGSKVGFCSFHDNTSVGGHGGAIYMASGKLLGNVYDGNIAPQCHDAFVEDTCSSK